MLPIVILYKRSNQDYLRQTNETYVYLLSRWKPGISLTLPLQIPFISHIIMSPRNKKLLLYLLIVPLEWKPDLNIILCQKFMNVLKDHAFLN